MTAADTRRFAIIWCTDGGDFDYWKYSAASMRLHAPANTDFFVIAMPKDSMHNIDRLYGLRRIDPTPYMGVLGFTKEGYDKLGKRWPVAILYKLCVPLIPEFAKYAAVMTLDTDVMAMPTSKLHTVSDVLNHPLGEFEIGGVPDLYEPLDRTATLIREKTPPEIRDELERRVWSKFGYGCQSYISAGLFLWNLPVINRDTDWYIRRCKAFWGNIRAYVFPEQDFVNQFMAVDCRFQSTFGARADGNGPYIVADACMRHFTGVGKKLMYNMGSKIPEITPASRFDQAGIHRRRSDIDPMNDKASPRRCIVWSCASGDEGVRRLRESISSVRDTCGDSLSGIDLFAVTDWGALESKLGVDGVKVINIDGMYEGSGFRSICNWRSGRIGWDRSKLSRLFVPFVPELSDYDLALFIEGDMLVLDKRMLDIFKTDVRGYDFAMSAEFRVENGLYLEHRHVRFCRAYLQAMYGIQDSNDVMCRLNAGCYFSTSVFLANMREVRKTFGSLNRMCHLGVSCVGNGAPAVEQNLFNSICRIRRVSGSYNTAGTTHFVGEPVYCVHNYSQSGDVQQARKHASSLYL